VNVVWIGIVRCVFAVQAELIGVWTKLRSNCCALWIATHFPLEQKRLRLVFETRRLHSKGS